MNKASGAQKAKINILAQQLGMDYELLHEYLFNLTGKRSIRELSIMEAVRVIDALSGREERCEYPAREHLSRKQKKYMEDLAIRLGMKEEDGSLNEKRLSGFCREMCHVESYTWLSRSQACKVIEGLKAMIGRMKETG